MKVTLVISHVKTKQLPDITEMSYQAAVCCATLKMLANVTPMHSVVKDKKTDKIVVEHACKIELLEDMSAHDTNKVLYLWRLLRDIIGIHCAWLEIDGVYAATGGNLISHANDGYKGCICDWICYKDNYEVISDSKPLTCSEY